VESAKLPASSVSAKNMRENPPEYKTQFGPDMHQDHTGVLAAPSQHGEASLAARPLELASVEAHSFSCGRLLAR